MIFHLSYRIRFIISCFLLRNMAKVYTRKKKREQLPVCNFRHPLSFSQLPYPVRGRAFPARRATRNQRNGDKFHCKRARAQRTGQRRFRVHRKCTSRLVGSRTSEVDRFARTDVCARRLLSLSSRFPLRMFKFAQPSMLAFALSKLPSRVAPVKLDRGDSASCV